MTSEPALGPVLDPATLRPVHADRVARLHRVHELVEALRGIDPQERGWREGEWDERVELLELYVAGGAFDVAERLLGELAGRARAARSRRHQFLARVVEADLVLAAGDYAAATLRFIELVHGAEKQPRGVQAVTHLRAGRCEFVQGMYTDAMVSFQWALAAGERARLPETFFAEAQAALGHAESALAQRIGGPDD